MDVFSHGLWTGAIAQFINKKIKKPLSIKWAVFWGVFPDIFAFGLPFIGIFWNLAFGNLNFRDLPAIHETEPPPEDTFWMFTLAKSLYNISHSLFIFLIVFSLVSLIFKRPILELGGWLLHILIDIPTHSYQFYPTPFLWPISSWKFSGLSWGTPWFMVLNYSVLIIIYFLLYRKRKLQKT